MEKTSFGGLVGETSGDALRYFVEIQEAICIHHTTLQMCIAYTKHIPS
jgi:hypothetical protein